MDASEERDPLVAAQDRALASFSWAERAQLNDAQLMLGPAASRVTDEHLARLHPDAPSYARKVLNTNRRYQLRLMVERRPRRIGCVGILSPAASSSRTRPRERRAAPRRTSRGSPDRSRPRPPEDDSDLVADGAAL